jgi:crotonobetainyl-CoA:carnitine CoA-transferase CaiB-like acyl-CoA transferase
MRPFENIRVIDMTHVLAGPFATYQLALLGADVIKVESPREPDQMRDHGNNSGLRQAQMATGFLTQSANKKSITLDIKTAEGRDVLKRLVATADIFVENYRPGAFDALELGYRHLKDVNPRLIYASMSAYGHHGPRSGQTGYDHIIQANSGMMAITGTPEHNPIKLGAPAVDYGTGIAGAFAISAALFQRTATGEGQHIDLAMCDVAIALMASHVTNYTYSGEAPKPTSGLNPVATSGTYQTAVGLVMLGATNLRQHERLWRAVGRPDMVKSSNEDRIRDNQKEIDALGEIMRTKDAAEWENYLQSKGVPAARVRGFAEMMADPHIEARGAVHYLSDVEGVDRPFAVPGPLFRLAHGGGSVDVAPRRLGSDTDDVLSGVGFAASEIEKLRAAGVIA